MIELIDKYYRFISSSNKVETTKEEKIVFTILSDLRDRNTLGNEFDMIDDEIQNEIIQTWIDIAKNNL